MSRNAALIAMGSVAFGIGMSIGSALALRGWSMSHLATLALALIFLGLTSAFLTESLKKG